MYLIGCIVSIIKLFNEKSGFKFHQIFELFWMSNSFVDILEFSMENYI